MSCTVPPPSFAASVEQPAPKPAMVQTVPAGIFDENLPVFIERDSRRFPPSIHSGQAAEWMLKFSKIRDEDVVTPHQFFERRHTFQSLVQQLNEDERRWIDFFPPNVIFGQHVPPISVMRQSLPICRLVNSFFSDGEMPLEGIHTLQWWEAYILAVYRFTSALKGRDHDFLRQDLPPINVPKGLILPALRRIGMQSLTIEDVDAYFAFQSIVSSLESDDATPSALLRNAGAYSDRMMHITSAFLYIGAPREECNTPDDVHVSDVIVKHRVQSGKPYHKTLFHAVYAALSQMTFDADTLGEGDFSLDKEILHLHTNWSAPEIMRMWQGEILSEVGFDSPPGTPKNKNERKQAALRKRDLSHLLMSFTDEEGVEALAEAFAEREERIQKKIFAGVSKVLGESMESTQRHVEILEGRAAVKSVRHIEAHASYYGLKEDELDEMITSFKRFQVCLPVVLERCNREKLSEVWGSGSTGVVEWFMGALAQTDAAKDLENLKIHAHRSLESMTSAVGSAITAAKAALAVVAACLLALCLVVAIWLARRKEVVSESSGEFDFKAALDSVIKNLKVLGNDIYEGLQVIGVHVSYIPSLITSFAKSVKAALAQWDEVSGVSTVLLTLFQNVLDALHSWGILSEQYYVEGLFSTKFKLYATEMMNIQKCVAASKSEPYYEPGGCYAAAVQILEWTQDQMIKKGITAHQRQIAKTWFEYLSRNLSKIRSFGSIGGSARQCPVVVQLNGAPNVGKSTAINALILSALHLLGHKITPEALQNEWDKWVYTVNASKEHFDGYKEQPITIYDDIFQYTDPQIQARECEFVVKAVNTAPYHIPMADLPDKTAHPFFVSKFIFLTSNVALSSEAPVKCPAALYRRLQLNYSVTRPGTEPGISLDNLRFERFKYDGGAHFSFKVGGTSNAVVHKIEEPITYEAVVEQMRAQLVEKQSEFRLLTESMRQAETKMMGKDAAAVEVIAARVSQAGGPIMQAPELNMAAINDILERQGETEIPALPTELREHGIEALPYDKAHYEEFATRIMRQMPGESPLRTSMLITVYNDAVKRAAEANESVSPYVGVIRRVKEVLTPLRAAIALAISVSAIGVGLYAMWKPAAPGAESHYGIKSPGKSKDRGVRATAEAPHQSADAHAAKRVEPPAQLGIIRNNVKTILVRKGVDVFVHGCILFVKDRTFVTCKHVWNQMVRAAHNHHLPVTVLDYAGQDCEFLPAEAEVAIVHEDAVAVSVSCLPQKVRDITKCFPTKDRLDQWSKEVEIQSIQTREAGYDSVRSYWAKGLEWKTRDPETNAILEKFNVSSGHWVTPYTTLGGGYSGTPLVHPKPIHGMCIMGLHTCGDSGNAYALPLTQEMLIAALSEKTSEVGHKGEIHCLRLLEKVGEAPGWRMARKSKLAPTPLYGPDIDLAPARLTSLMVDGELRDPLDMAICKFVGGEGLRNESLAKKGALVMAKTLARLTNCVVPTISVRQAVHGIPDVLDSLDLTTSAGYPWNVQGYTKRDLVSHDPPSISPELLEAVEAQKKKPHAIFDANLKDEPRSREKVDAGKTRPIFASPIDYTVYIRTLFGVLTKFISQHCVELGIAVGFDPSSALAHDVAIKVLSNKKFFVGDFKNFDANQAYALLEHIIEYLARLKSYDEIDEAREALRVIIDADLAAFGHVLRMVAGLPSGHPLTLIINSLFTKLVWCCIFVHCGLTEKEILELTYVLSMGDDHSTSIHPSLEHRLPFSKIQEACDELGVVLTCADKTDLSNAKWESDPDKWEFLKRGVRFDQELCRYVMPLAEQSILKSLMFYRPKSVSLHKHMASELERASRELSLYSKEDYDRISDWVRERCAAVHLPTKQLSPWDEARLCAGVLPLEELAIRVPEVLAQVGFGATAQAGPGDGVGPSESVAPNDVAKLNSVDESIVTPGSEELLDVETTGGSTGVQLDGMPRLTIQKPQMVEPSLIEWAERPFRILSNAAITTSNARGTILAQYPMPSTFMNQSRNYTKFYGVYGFRAGGKFRLIVNASPFQAGIIGIAAIPVCGIQKISKLHITQITSGRVVYINLGDGQNEATIEWPYTNAYAFTRNRWNAAGTTIPADGYADDVCNVVVFVVSPLTVGSGSPTNADITGYISLKDFEPIGATVSSQAGFEREKSGVAGPSIAKVVKQAAEGAAVTLGLVPGFEMLSGAAKWSSDLARGAAVAFGFSIQPPPQPAVMSRMNRFGMSTSTGVKIYQPLGIQQEPALSLNPQIHQTPEDELSVSMIASKKCWLGSFTWSTTHNVGDSLIWYNVNPGSWDTTGTFNCDTVPTGTVTTTMGFLSRFGAMWRAKARYTFMIAATAFHSGAIEFVYVPTTPEVTTSTTSVFTQGEYVYRMVCSIKDGKVCEMVTPFVSQFNMASSYGGAAYSNALIPGRLYVNVVNALIATSTAVATTINCETFLSGDDVQLAYPYTEYTQIIRNIVPGSSSAPALAQAGFGANPDAAPIGLSNADQITSLRQLLKIHSGYTGIITTNADAGSTQSTARPTFVNTHDVVLGGVDSAVGPTYIPNYQQDWVSTILMAYAYYRGSMRLGVHDMQANPTANVRQYPLSISLTRLFEQNTGSGQVGTDNVTSASGTRYIGGPTLVTTSTENGHEVLVPFYNSKPAQLTMPVWPTSTGTNTPSFNCSLREVRPDQYIAISTPQATQITITRAVADDFDAGTWFVTPVVNTTGAGSAYSSPIWAQRWS